MVTRNPDPFERLIALVEHLGESLGEITARLARMEVKQQVPTQSMLPRAFENMSLAKAARLFVESLGRPATIEEIWQQLRSAGVFNGRDWTALEEYQAVRSAVLKNSWDFYRVGNDIVDLVERSPEKLTQRTPRGRKQKEEQAISA